MLEYHKIETLYERDPKTFKVIPGAIKNRVYSLLKFWQWSEKVDGTNIRIMWTAADNRIKFGGRTDSAQIPADLYTRLAELFPAEKFAAIFPTADVTVYGEGYGAGIQKGGGEYSATKDFIAFDVFVDNKWWLAYENVVDIAAKLGTQAVADFGLMSLEDATEFVRAGFKSKIGGGIKDAEGLVGRPTEALFDKKGHRLIVKLKTKDF